MEKDNPDMRAVKAAAREELGQVQGVQGVGLGEGTLRVYVQNPDVRKQLPSEFKGVPIDFVVTGDVSAFNVGP